MKSILIRIYTKDGKTRELRSSRFLRRILSSISLVYSKEAIEKVYVKVSYGKKMDEFKTMTEFYNDGFYIDKDEVAQIIKTFWAES